MGGSKRVPSRRWKPVVPVGTDSSSAAGIPEWKWKSGQIRTSSSLAAASESKSTGATARTDSLSSLAAASESKLKASDAGGRIRIVNGYPPAEPTVIAITSRSHDEVLEYTHAFVTAYSRRRFRAALATQLSVATYELLENALNYGSVMGEVELQIAETPKSVAIRVSNETAQVRLDMMRAHLDRVNRDPEAAFLEEMRRSVAGGRSRPMLGLTRIVHEAKLLLEVYVAASRVTVIARAPS